MAGPTCLTARDDAPAPPRLWRSFSTGPADILCLEEAGLEIRPRMHGRLAVTLLLSQAVIRGESSRSIEAEQGSVLLLPPRHLYGLRAQVGTLRTATLLLGSSELEHHEGLTGSALVCNPELGTQLEAHLSELRPPNRSAEGVAATRSIVGRLLRVGVPLAPAARSRATSLAPVHDYLRARLGGQIPMAALVPLCGLTESHLIRAFHLEFGMPPHAYHLRLRIAAAAELLAKGLSVSAVTYECGFADQSHLSRKFKEVYGLTPAGWAAAAQYPSRSDRVASTSHNHTIPRMFGTPPGRLSKQNQRTMTT